MRRKRSIFPILESGVMQVPGGAGWEADVLSIDTDGSVAAAGIGIMIKRYGSKMNTVLSFIVVDQSILIVL